MNRMEQYNQSRLRADPSVIIPAESPTTTQVGTSHISPGPDDTTQTLVPSPVHVSPTHVSPDTWCCRNF